MTDSMLSETPESVPTPAPAPASEALPSAGQIIRAARLKKGMHLAVLSVTLKVPIRQLEALEADQHDTSKGPAFVRALASSVCRQLQIDPAPVLALLPHFADRLPLERQAYEPLNSSPKWRFDAFSVLRNIPAQTLAIAGVMLALIVALLWLPSPSSWSWLQSKPQAAAHTEPAAADGVAMASEASAPEVPPSQAMASEIQPPPSSVQAPQPAASSSPVASKPALMPYASGLAEFGFVATEDSWIEIRDGNNQVLWTRVVHAGETAQVQYPLPMSVVIGRARAVSVTYKGKPFDLAPHTKVTVARFEVKE